MRYRVGMQTKSTSVRVDEDTLSNLRLLSDRSGVSISRLITLATAQYMTAVEKAGSIEVPLKTEASKREYPTKRK